MPIQMVFCRVSALIELSALANPFTPKSVLHSENVGTTLLLTAPKIDTTKSELTDQTECSNITAGLSQSVHSASGTNGASEHTFK